MSELKVLFPKPVLAMVGGHPVRIMPVKLRDLEAFGAAVGAVVGMLGNAAPSEIYRFAADSGGLQLVLRSCTDLSRWRLRRLPASVAIELMLAVISINSDFFGQALARAANQPAGAV